MDFMAFSISSVVLIGAKFSNNTFSQNREMPDLDALVDPPLTVMLVLKLWKEKESRRTKRRYT